VSRRTTIVLGVVAAGAVAAAIIVTLSGRSSESAQHRAVARYVTEVDAVQQDMTLELARVRDAYRGLGLASTGRGANGKRELERAEQTMRLLQQRLAGVAAPPVASKLRRLLLQLAAADVRIAHEVNQLALFMPQFAAAGAAGRAAAVRLTKDLGALKPPAGGAVRGTAQQVAAARAAYEAASAAAAAAQADAVDGYDRALGRVLDDLRRLDPPPVLAPAYRAQVATYEMTRAAGGALSRELRGPDRSRVPLLNRRFIQATRHAASDAAQKAEIAAVKAYDARIKGTRTLQVAIRTELLRLQSTVR
jgi:hypothetical protein